MASSDVVKDALTHPRIIIQPDWSVNVRSNILPVDVWIEFKAAGGSIARLTQNIHGVCSVKASSGEDAKSYKTSVTENFQSGDIDKQNQQLRIKIRDADFSHTFRGPTKSFLTSGKADDDEVIVDLDPLVHVPELVKNRAAQPQLSAYPHWFDISSGGVGLTAFNTGKITIWDIENGEVRRKLKDHVEDVYVSRFFPSDFAVVSGGADMRVKIWSLDSENNQIRDATLSGHRSRINDVLAIDQQRVLSASNDGSVLLWDTTKTEPINKIAELENNSINSICLTDSSSTVVCACNDGSIRLYDLKNENSNKKATHTIKIGSPISAVCYLPELNQLIYGTEQSGLGIYDIRQVNNEHIHAWKEQRGKITCIIPGKDNGGIIATSADGSCFEYAKDELKALSTTVQAHVFDYTGADDAVLNAKVFNKRIYSVARDGLVRVYDAQD